MINLIVGLITSIIYAYTTENPGVFATISWGLFMISYVYFFRQTIALHLTIDLIAKDNQLTKAFVDAAKRKVDGYKD